MTQPTKPSQRDLDPENEHLMSHAFHDDHDEEKLQNSDKSLCSSGNKLRPFTTPGLVTLITSTALISMLLSGLALRFLHIFNLPESSSPLPGSRFGSCGNTTSSARRANCTFDIMSFSWLPSACDDPKLTAEFSRVRNWTWWLDTDKMTFVPFEEVARGDHSELFVAREYHMYHCTYMWKKLHRGLLKSQQNAEKRGIMDSYIGNYGHTSHCEMMLLGMEEDGGEINKDATDTAILMKFTQCVWT